MNYFEYRNIPKEDYSFNLSEDVLSKLERFKHYDENSRIEKIIYLARIFKEVNPPPETLVISKELLEPKVRHKRTGNVLPKDVIELICKVSNQHGISRIAAFDLILNTGFKLSKEYSLQVTLVKL